jgi:hypothetical protein
MKALAIVATIIALGGAGAGAQPATMSSRDGPDAAPYTGRIEVVSEPGLESLGRDLAASAEEELSRIAADLIDLPVPRRIEIHLVRDASELPSVAPPGHTAPPWAIGVAYPDVGVVSVATRRGAQVVDAHSTLRHELAHLALGAALGDRAPHWLHEGFAYQHSGEWSWDRSETLAGMAWFGGIIPIHELDASFPAEEAPANRAYAESYDFVGFLSRRGRWEDPEDDGDRWPFRRFLAEVGHGKSLDAAAIHAFGKPIDQLFDEWRDNLGKRYLWAPVGLLGLALWIVCALLLTLAWWRRRRQNRRRIAQWEREDALREHADPHLVVVPPYVPWPGSDPLVEEPDEGHEPPLPN